MLAFVVGGRRATPKLSAQVQRRPWVRARRRHWGRITISQTPQRAHEEAQGRVHWLRPQFQSPQKTTQKQELPAQEQQALGANFDTEKPLSKTESSKSQQHPWPVTLPEQVRAVAEALARRPAPLTLPALEAHFKGRGPWKKGLPTLLQTLKTLGCAQAVKGEVAWRG